MIAKFFGSLAIACGLALSVSGCVDDYGYGGMSVGYGDAGYYGDPYYDGYGYGGYGYPSYYGWYGDYYYPGAGIYVYDQYRRPYRWNDAQQRYWSGRQRYRGRDWDGRGSWNGFDRRQPPNQAYDGDRRRRPNDPGRTWRGDRNGFAPGPQGVQPGPRTEGDRTFTPPPQRNPGQWSGRSDGGRAARSGNPNRTRTQRSD